MPAPRKKRPAETELYAPVKALLAAQGYDVKGEVAGADLVACRGDDPPVIVELKAGFALALYHQAVARQALTDAVYIAVPRGSGRGWARALAENRALCRRLGVGLIAVRLADGTVEVHLDPAPYQPRQNPARRTRLLREFARRTGDPNLGGSPARAGLVTAYRQDALRLARYLAEHGPAKGAVVARATGVGRATRMMADDHYGWFERVARGIFALTRQGRVALKGPDENPSGPDAGPPR